MAVPGVPVMFIISGIPRRFRSAHLRHYFSQFTESGGFICFHFRHRPERRGGDAGGSGTYCCPVTVRSDQAQSFLRMYGGKPWMDTEGNQVPGRCQIRRVREGLQTGSQDFPYKTRRELQASRCTGEEQHVTEAELHRLPELNPPALMPQGNVGTPIEVFLQLIRSCRLPPMLIKRLGLSFPCAGRRYSKVPFCYVGTEMTQCEEGVYTASGQEITEGGSTGIEGCCTKEEPDPAEESHSDDDNDTCEEWERHEALHEDVTTQERTTERLFEEKIELKWEKGGSGLVFYTDAQVWQEQEGDFDEQTADDWDVDMSGYYETGAGDKDARDYLRMRMEGRRRNGLDVPAEAHSLGVFEQHTKGIGRKVMERQGWKEGTGLGARGAGMPDALENEGQNPKCRRGFGYHGEKLQTFCLPRPKASHFISTIYDKPRVEDTGDTLLRRQFPTAMKYRDSKARNGDKD